MEVCEPPGRMEERVQRTVESFSPSALKTARLRRKWTLDDLADVSSVSAGTLSLWEQNKRQPTITNLTRVAAALDVPVADLLVPSRREPSLVDYRRAAGLTIQAAARLAGLSTAPISRAENGHGTFTDRVIAALAQTYGVTEQQLEAAWAQAKKDRLVRLKAR